MAVVGLQVEVEDGLGTALGSEEPSDLDVDPLGDEIGGFLQGNVEFAGQDHDRVAEVVEADLLVRGVQVVDPRHDIGGGFAHGRGVRVADQVFRHRPGGGDPDEVGGGVQGTGQGPVGAVRALVKRGFRGVDLRLADVRVEVIGHVVDEAVGPRGGHARTGTNPHVGRSFPDPRHREDVELPAGHGSRDDAEEGGDELVGDLGVHLRVAGLHRVVQDVVQDEVGAHPVRQDV
ncbi:MULTISPECIES: hypothetical protein [unclassified Streptomyces]|uniref:hypothetical protein n=1 Tax=unclassified Streptomyces TaxID=2593676 RepID=UPI00114D25E2|nr:hypothetical protein [Streptomyces sp. MnatMP-M77]MYT82321.1 hypothetical protein [Streptomyces sp. SID8364]